MEMKPQRKILLLIEVRLFFFFFLRTLTDYFFPYRFYLCYPFLPIGSHGIPLELGAHCEGANQIIDFQWVCSLTLSCALN